MRTFRIAYRLRGVSVAYDDVVDVNLQVWGDEWEVALGQLTAQLLAPGDVSRAGATRSQSGATSRSTATA